MSILLLLVVLSGCERDSAPARTAAAPAPAAGDKVLSPSETVQVAHEHRLAGRLGELELLVVPQQRAAVLALVQSMDRLAAGQDALAQAIGEKFGVATADTFVSTQLANIIGVYSQEVEVVAERMEHGKAVVSIQVAGRLPLEEVALVPVEGRWMIQTDPPIPGLPDEIRKLAGAYQDLARLVREGRADPDQVRRELDLRYQQTARRINELTEKAAGEQPESRGNED